MCRAFLILDTKPNNNDRAKSLIVLNYVINSYDLGNNDGYFLQIDSKIYKTMDIYAFLNYIKDNIKTIDNANVIQGHLRIATNSVVGKKGIHGFKFGDYYCSHNGIMHDYSYGHDSKTFFSKCDKVKFKPKAIAKLFADNEGYGVFFAVNPTGNKFAFSKNKEITIHLINKHLLVMNSQNDIHEQIDTEIAINSKKNETIKHKFGILEFNETIRTNTTTITYDNNTIFNDIVSQQNNKVITFDKNNQPIAIIPIKKPKTKYYDYNKNIWKNSKKMTNWYGYNYKGY